MDSGWIINMMPHQTKQTKKGVHSKRLGGHLKWRLQCITFGLMHLSILQPESSALDRSANLAFLLVGSYIVTISRTFEQLGNTRNRRLQVTMV